MKQYNRVMNWRIWKCCHLVAIRIVIPILLHLRVLYIVFDCLENDGAFEAIATVAFWRKISHCGNSSKEWNLRGSVTYGWRKNLETNPRTPHVATMLYQIVYTNRTTRVQSLTYPLDVLTKCSQSMMLIHKDRQ